MEIDRFGIFAEVEVNSVSFKMRYLPPGSFLTRSPVDDEGHVLMDEGPQHETQILEKLSKANIDFILVGGLASVTQGGALTLWGKRS